MRTNRYDVLRSQYPEFISKIQMYKICGISPLSATYLIQNGIIPAIDTGKNTWRYKIRLEDVITYLESKKEKGSLIPKGAVTSKKPTSPNKPARAHIPLLVNEDSKLLRDYFSFIFSDFPDLLGMQDIAEMTGLCNKTILLHHKQGSLLSIGSGHKIIIPKEYALDYFCGPKFLSTKSSSENYMRLLGGFQLWINAKS